MHGRGFLGLDDQGRGKDGPRGFRGTLFPNSYSSTEPSTGSFGSPHVPSLVPSLSRPLPGYQSGTTPTCLGYLLYSRSRWRGSGLPRPLRDVSFVAGDSSWDPPRRIKGSSGGSVSPESTVSGRPRSHLCVHNRRPADRPHTHRAGAPTVGGWCLASSAENPREGHRSHGLGAAGGETRPRERQRNFTRLGRERVGVSHPRSRDPGREGSVVCGVWLRCPTQTVFIKCTNICWTANTHESSDL